MVAKFPHQRKLGLACGLATWMVLPAPPVTPLAWVQVGFPRSQGFIGVWSAPFQANEADAVTLDAGLVYEAGLAPYNLKPVVAEIYGSKDSKFSLGTQESWWPLLSDRRLFSPCRLLSSSGR